MSKDFYKTLGVEKGASDSEIKSAYRKMALKWHPDKHKGDKEAEKKFKEINEAYEVLSDKQKRQQYDTFGSAGANGFQGFGGGSGGFNFNGFQGQGNANAFSDIFEAFFGGGFGGMNPNAPRRGSDIEASIQITFNDAAFGCEKELEISAPDGQGGRVKERVKVKIPAGITNRSTIRVSGKGGKGIRGGSNGDLYITLLVERHPNFVRSGADVHSEIKIHMLQALLGTELEVDTIHGPEKVKIPAGTQHGTVFKVSGKGTKQLNSDKMGNHMAKILVEIPKKLSKKEKELYEQIAEETKLEVKKGGLFW